LLYLKSFVAFVFIRQGHRVEMPSSYLIYVRKGACHHITTKLLRLKWRPLVSHCVARAVLSCKARLGARPVIFLDDFLSVLKHNLSNPVSLTKI